MFQFDSDQYLGRSATIMALRIPRRPDQITFKEISQARKRRGPGQTNWWRNPNLSNEEIAHELSLEERRLNDPRLQALLSAFEISTNRKN